MSGLETSGFQQGGLSGLVGERHYIAIDLKSFYASIECVERGLDPLDTCLVVADASRTQKTICLAVSPALKAFGIGGRPRLFEVTKIVNEANRMRGKVGKSFSYKSLKEHPDLAIDFIIATPRMSHYIYFSTKIYEIYLRFIAPEDIHVYSIDEVFIDATDYMKLYNLSAHVLTMKIIRTILKETGITATAGIGTNLYLAKIAMDIMAKKMQPDKDGVRIAELNEMSYRHELWEHTPLTDFWRIGSGISRSLASCGIYTMGDIARTSLHNEDLLYRLFGVNAELLIDHAWGWEPVTISQIKAYRPISKSVSSGQVLQSAYTADKSRTVALEMADSISYDLIEKGLVTDQLVLTIGYDAETLTNQSIASTYRGEIHVDRYGRKVPAHSHGTINIDTPTSSAHILVEKTGELFDRIINKKLLVRRLNLTLNHVVSELEVRKKPRAIQLNLFTDYDEINNQERIRRQRLDKERKQQEAILKLRQKYGKNVILTGLNFAEGATQKDRNKQIGGHKA